MPACGCAIIRETQGEMGKICHMMTLARETESGIRPEIWVDIIGEFLRQRGRTNDFVFQRARGKQSKANDYDDEFLVLRQATSGSMA
jgi:hypothetical protein